MPNTNKTLIVALLDKSGAMQPLAESTISGFNEFIVTQKNLEGEANVSLVLFNEKNHEIYRNKNIKDVNSLVREDFIPNGFTALYSGLDSLIDSTGRDLAALSEKDRPGKVIFLIITDGEDNKSGYITANTVKQKIDHQKSQYNWEFIFLGANIDVKEAATKLGINNFASYSANPTDTLVAYASMDRAVKSMRSTGSVSTDWADALNK